MITIYKKYLSSFKLLKIYFILCIILFFFTMKVSGQQQINPYAVQSKINLCDSQKIDCIYNPKTKTYEPFYPKEDRVVGDFVNSGRLGSETNCNNQSNLNKKIDSLNNVGQFIKTSLLGKHKRCVIEVDKKQITDPDFKYFGTGQVMNYSKNCFADKDKEVPCIGTGNVATIPNAPINTHRKYGVTSAHNFIDVHGNIITNGFDFTSYVWIPPKKRKIPNVIFEVRKIKIKRVYVATSNPDAEPDNDYAFYELEEPVSEVVDGVIIPERYRIKPYLLTDKVFEANELNNNVTTVGIHQDNDKYLQKSCDLIGIYDVKTDSEYRERSKNLFYHDADTLPGSSGSLILEKTRDGTYVIVALHSRGNSEREKELELINQNKQVTLKNDNYNTAIKAHRMFRDFSLFIDGKL